MAEQLGAQHHAEIEDDVGDLAREHRIDISSNALEYTFGGAKEDVARKPVELDGITGFAQVL